MCRRFLKILCVFFVLTIFVLSGCHSVEKKEDNLKTDFSADFSAEYREGEYKGRLSTNRQGVLSNEITYPQTIEGLSVRYYSGEMHIARENLDSSADEAYLPDTSFPSVIKSVFDGINGGRTTLVSVSDEECERTLQLSTGNAIIKCRDNIAVQVEIKEIDFCIYFENIKIIE